MNPHHQRKLYALLNRRSWVRIPPPVPLIERDERELRVGKQGKMPLSGSNTGISEIQFNGIPVSMRDLDRGDPLSFLHKFAQV
jgi:hypothetical protein